MIKKLYLLDSTEGKIRISEYIDFRVKSENPSLFRELYKETKKVVDRIYSDSFGKDWRVIFKKFKNCISLSKIYIPRPDKVDEYIKSYKYKNLLNISIYTKDLYPYYPEFLLKLVESDIDTNKISELLIKTVDLKCKLISELLKEGIISSLTGELLPKTFGELKSKSRSLFDWYIDDYLRRHEDIQGVTVVSEEEDLKKLREWIPEVMI